MSSNENHVGATYECEVPLHQMKQDGATDCLNEDHRCGSPYKVNGKKIYFNDNNNEPGSKHIDVGMIKRGKISVGKKGCQVAMTSSLGRTFGKGVNTFRTGRRATMNKLGLNKLGFGSSTPRLGGKSRRRRKKSHKKRKKKGGKKSRRKSKKSRRRKSRKSRKRRR